MGHSPQLKTLYRIIAALLVLIAIALLFGHDTTASAGPALNGALQATVGVVAGFAIGVVASLLGVAGGELLIPTLVLLFGADIKLAGSLFPCGEFADDDRRLYSLQSRQQLRVLGKNRRFVLTMAAGSILGSFIGGRLLGHVSNTVLLPLLAVILLISSVKVWRHE